MLKKKITSIFLIMIVVLAMVPQAALMSVHADEMTSHSHNGIEFQPWNETGSLPNTAGSYYLTKDVTLTVPWTVPAGTTNLCLNGHHITVGEGWNTENTRLIQTNVDVKNNSTVLNLSVLNLYDCGKEEYHFDINGTSGIAQNIVPADSNNNDGQTFKGGYIYGSGKAVIGVGVNYGEFNMYGGTIIGNGNGGVSTIQYQESIFKLYGGNILGNVSGLGGGVLINNGSFNMTGGKISYNTAEIRQYGEYYAGGSGGGVKVETGSFTMSGGEISYNTAEVEGGGVSINEEQDQNSRSMTLTGGSIKNNVSKTGAGGIEIKSSGTFLLSGNPVVSGNQMKINNNTEDSNAVLNSGVEIKVNGKLNEGCKVHVKMKKPSENGKPLAFTKGYSSDVSGETAYKNTENPSEYFTSDDDSFIVDLNTSGEAIQGTPHEIKIINPSNGSIKVKDSGTEAEAVEEACVTVTATPSGGYELGSISVKDDDGNAVALTGSGNTRTFTMPASDVTVTASFYVSQSSIDPKVSIAGWIYGNYDAAVNAPVVTGNLGEGAVSFTYYTDARCRTKTTAANSGAAADGGVPVRAGSYWVKADVEETYYYTGGSATAGFTVAKAPLTITADSDSKIYDGTPLTKDTVKCEGLVKGDAVKSVTVSGTQTDAGRSDNVPSDAVIKNGKDSDVTDCYEIAYVNGILEVTKAELTVTAEEKTKVYGEDDPILTYQTAGLAEGEVLTGSLERTEGENAGIYEIRQGTLAASDNYILTYVPANFTVIPKKIIAKADAKTKIEDKKDPKFTYTVEGLVGTDKLKGKLTRKPGELPGKYEILQGTLSASANYDLTYKGAKLTIKPIPVRPAKPEYTLFAGMTAPGFNELILTWASVKDAKGYDIYFGEAGKKCAYAGYVKASDARALHFTGLKVYTVYKAYVKAWKKVKGRKTYIGKASPAVSTITGGYTEKYCNAKSIAVKKAELTVKKGKTGRIKAAVQGVLSDRTVYKPSNLVRYYSSNRKVATVDKDGIVHGKAAGTCKIYAMTNNGIRTSVKITVVR